MAFEKRKKIKKKCMRSIQAIKFVKAILNSEILKVKHNFASENNIRLNETIENGANTPRVQPFLRGSIPMDKYSRE